LRLVGQRPRELTAKSWSPGGRSRAIQAAPGGRTRFSSSPWDSKTAAGASTRRAPRHTRRLP